MENNPPLPQRIRDAVDLGRRVFLVVFVALLIITGAIAIYKFVFEPITLSWQFHDWLAIDWTIYIVGTITYYMFWSWVLMVLTYRVMK